MRQLNNMGDTKVGTLVGTDKLGNKYYESWNEHYGNTTSSRRKSSYLATRNQACHNETRLKSHRTVLWKQKTQSFG